MPTLEDILKAGFNEMKSKTDLSDEAVFEELELLHDRLCNIEDQLVRIEKAIETVAKVLPDSVL